MNRQNPTVRSTARPIVGVLGPGREKRFVVTPPIDPTRSVPLAFTGNPQDVMIVDYGSDFVHLRNLRRDFITAFVVVVVPARLNRVIKRAVTLPWAAIATYVKDTPPLELVKAAFRALDQALN